MNATAIVTVSFVIACLCIALVAALAIRDAMASVAGPLA